MRKSQLDLKTHRTFVSVGKSRYGLLSKPAAMQTDLTCQWQSGTPQRALSWRRWCVFRWALVHTTTTEVTFQTQQVEQKWRRAIRMIFLIWKHTFGGILTKWGSLHSKKGGWYVIYVQYLICERIRGAWWWADISSSEWKEAVGRVSDHIRTDCTPGITRNMAKEIPWAPFLIFKKQLTFFGEWTTLMLV